MNQNVEGGSCQWQYASLLSEKLMMKTKNTFLLLLAWSVIVLLLLSIDSPLHEVYGHNDSAWFFMCGKAVMNGLTPYVDFTDSKGPLLWLIYGIGYLISPRNYVGVWVLTCLCYAGTLFYNYKTARLLLADDRKALLVALLMPLAYFLPWFHYEVRAEDFCFLPVAVTIYYLFHLLYNKEGESYSIRHYGLVLGGCFMALVLIKYSLAVMQASMIIVALWYWMWERSEYGAPLKWLLCGMAAVALPFVIWLTAVGAFPAFVDEYFINTFHTVTTEKGFMATLSEEMTNSWSAINSQALLLIIALGGWLLSRLLPCYRYVPLVISLFFYLVCTRHNMNYYYSACYSFLLFLFIYLISQLRKPVRTWNYVLAAAVVLVWSISENVRSTSPKQMTTKWATTSYRDSYNRIARAIDGEKPLMMNLCAGEFGFGMAAKALPAGKYWSKQVGMTPEMLKGHKDLLKSGRADYVIALDDVSCYRDGLTPQYIRSLGYEVCDSLVYVDYKRHQRTTLVYRKKK